MAGAEDELEAAELSPQLRSVHTVCTRYNDGTPCRAHVVYSAPHYCEECLSTTMRGMRIRKPRVQA
eukprot:6200259-Pleurochrysis_carterae.AAC.2